MNTNDSTVRISEEELAKMGGGAVAYIREIAEGDAAKLLGSRPLLPSGTKLFCLYNADGTPISISGSHEAAMGSALENELLPMSVH